MKPDLTLLDSLRQLIDFAGLSGDATSQRVLSSMLEDVARAIEQERLMDPANLAGAPSCKPVFGLKAEPQCADPLAAPSNRAAF